MALGQHLVQYQIQFSIVSRYSKTTKSLTGKHFQMISYPQLSKEKWQIKSHPAYPVKKRSLTCKDGGAHS